MNMPRFFAGKNYIKINSSTKQKASNHEFDQLREVANMAFATQIPIIYYEHVARKNYKVDVQISGINVNFLKISFFENIIL